MTLMVRSASAPASLIQPVLSRLGELDANLPVFNVRTMEAQVRDSVFGLMAASMAAGQGVIALLLLSNLLYGLAPADLGALVTTTVLVFAISLVACIMPARRATASDPLVALRYD